jgi:hydroxyethylthiazole kinase-like uncharacterized protein yjeF
MIIVTCAQMRAIEKYAMSEGMSSLRLMENAGSAAAHFIRETVQLSGKRCAVLCGHGNNGGDGFVVARRLIEANAKVYVILADGFPKTNEAYEMFERLNSLNSMNIEIIDHPQLIACKNLLRHSDIIIDALYGTGFHGAIENELIAELVSTVNESQAKVFALDMPSGASADTGEVGGVCINADITVTFSSPKVGQYIFPAADYCGRIAAVNIGIPESAYSMFDNSVELLEKRMISEMLPVRAKDSNKGNYGRVFCLCGSLGMAGAAYLAASGALRCGAGLITVGVPKSVYCPVASKLDECMVYPLEETANGALSYSALDKILELSGSANVLLIGCGLSRDVQTQQLVRKIVADAECTIILDADGINAFEGHIDLLRTSKAELILTPHPGEMSRLCGKTISQVQSSRLDTAREFAVQNGVTLVLKGANTIVAAKDGRAFINPTGNPGMAKGGSGDILAGMTAAFAAQGISPEKSACCGVFIHGSAGDNAAEKYSQYGMIPTDMLREIPQIFREML